MGDVDHKTAVTIGLVLGQYAERQLGAHAETDRGDPAAAAHGAATSVFPLGLSAPRSSVLCSDFPTKGQTMSTTGTATGERADLLQALAKQRHFLRYTVRDLTDEQAGRRTTASELCLGGLIKHVALTEQQWANFIVDGPAAMGGWDETDQDAWTSAFRMLPGETLAGVLAEYEKVAHRTDELVVTVPDLDAAHPLPEAPWFERGAHWSARRVLLHIIAETAQHAGHADIIRESLDGAKSMG
jgi:hypothetical protein